MEQQNNQIEKVPTFSKPDPTACLIKNINVEPTDISVGNYQSFLRGEDFDIFTSDLSLEVTDKLISSIPENHDLFVQEGFVNKTDKDAYQVYSDTDSVIGDTIIKVNGKDIKIEDLWNNYGEIIDSNKAKWFGSFSSPDKETSLLIIDNFTLSSKKSFKEGINIAIFDNSVSSITILFPKLYSPSLLTPKILETFFISS